MKLSKIEKQAGRVYTPAYLVSNILDLCGYTGSEIFSKHVIDNSCGDGVVLQEVARRYCEAALSANMLPDLLNIQLSTHIHGIELDPDECVRCRQRLDALIREFGLSGVKWDIQCADALTHTEHLGRMDYVFGNPPYVRVHNLKDSFDTMKNNFSFARGGMQDIYLSFYELGLYMLNDTGVLGYITPSSFFNSKAGDSMREYLTAARSIRAIVDLKHFQPFGATTYSAIAVLTKQPNDTVAYYEYDEQRLVKVKDLDYSDFCADDGTFNFASNEAQQRVLSSSGAASAVRVKNGITTMLDEFFFSDKFPFKEHVIPVVKASTGKQTKCLFPYDNYGKLLPLDSLSAQVQRYFAENEEKLKVRDINKHGDWHGFGRAQGIKDVFVTQYAVNSLIRDEKDIKFTVCPSGTGVYGGLYIITEFPADGITQVLVTKEFASYVKALGKYKSGGYYAYSSVDLQRFLNYRLSKVRLFEF